MRHWLYTLAAVCFLAYTLRVSATEFYVDATSAAPAAPYTNWSTAAKVIQDAVDLASSGDRVLVTNGVYQTGGRGVAEAINTNRVVITNAVRVESVNGQAFTVIEGYQVPQTVYGTNAVRCAYLGDGAVLAGFTLRGGATSYAAPRGGAAWCQSQAAVLSNCVVVGNAASFTGGGVFQGTLNDCILSNNSSGFVGGGAYLATLNNCTLSSNTATNEGGGADTCTLNHCVLTGNRVFEDSGGDGGGGAHAGTLNHCTLSGNWAFARGGGAYGSTLTNCTLEGNATAVWGGGAAYCTMSACTLAGNSALYGGGAEAGLLLDCTIVGNSRRLARRWRERGHAVAMRGDQ